MSIQIKEKVVETIDDARGLTPLECIGLIFDHIICDDDLKTIWLFSQIVNSTGWSFTCDPELKSCILEINNSLRIDNKKEEIRCEFIPNNEEGIIIKISIANHSNLDKELPISIDRLEDLMI